MGETRGRERPPDLPRAHAGVGWMTEHLYHRLTDDGAEVYVIPTLGQHVPHTPEHVQSARRGNRRRLGIDCRAWQRTLVSPRNFIC